MNYTAFRNRLRRLEQAAASEVRVTVFRLPSFTGLIDDPVTIVGDSGEWQRDPGESVAAFRERAGAAAAELATRPWCVLQEINRDGIDPRRTRWLPQQTYGAE